MLSELNVSVSIGGSYAVLILIVMEHALGVQSAVAKGDVYKS